MRDFTIEAVLFDFDGTLTKPGGIDFPGLRAALGIAPGTYALEHFESLVTGPKREEAEAILHRFEEEGAARAEPNDGAEAVVRRLRSAGLPVGMITRNRLPMIEAALRRFAHLSLEDFDVVVTRDLDIPFKPEPDTIFYAAERLGVAPERCAMVGDFVVDVEAGHQAGAVTVLLATPGEEVVPAYEPDFRIESLDELEAVLGLGS